MAGRKRRVGDRPVVYRSLGWAERVGVLVAVISASAALLTVAITGYSTSRSLKATNDQLSIAQQGQVTDRFGRAVEQLGSAAMDVRLGGIYSLERLARDSPPDQPTIVKVLSSFIRGHARRNLTRLPAGAAIGPNETAYQLGDDVDAALVVLGRRDRSRDNGVVLDLSEVDFHQVKLDHLDLRGFDLSNARFDNATLFSARFDGADMSWVDLSHSDLSFARLDGAELTVATLVGTYLDQARLDGAVLIEADMRGAFLTAGTSLNETSLSNVRLDGAHLEGADFRRAHLDGADLRCATADHATRLPPGITPPKPCS